MAASDESSRNHAHQTGVWLSFSTYSSVKKLAITVVLMMSLNWMLYIVMCFYSSWVQQDIDFQALQSSCVHLFEKKVAVNVRHFTNESIKNNK
jgi:hypothetical protein